MYNAYSESLFYLLIFCDHVAWQSSPQIEQHLVPVAYLSVQRQASFHWVMWKEIEYIPEMIVSSEICG
jgi:hypothetical protein